MKKDAQTNHDIHQLIKQRWSARAFSQEPIELDKLIKTTWTHIDRIYRGGRGDSSTSSQAVFTKDIAYYDGYKKIRDYLDQSIRNGKDIEQIFEYLTLGKFNPTNPVHIQYVKQSIAD